MFIVVFTSAPQISKAVDDAYYSLKPEQIVTYIKRNEGQRRVVFLYASWCGYCRAAMPQMIALEQSNPGSVIAVSIDKNPQKLTDYMRKFQNVPFDIIVWNREQNLNAHLGRLGIKPTRGIPFAALLNEEGRIHKQGNLRTQDIIRYISSAPEKSKRI